MDPNYFNQTIHEKPLLILNASAGSGKTFNLVKNYLRLLLLENEQTEISQILAMTFTNKASIEMKNRIVGDLAKLAFGEAKDQHFIAEIAAFIKSTPEKTTAKAKNVLRKLLHQYEDFGIMTIDKFNLRLIRSFARDLDLPDNFEISTNDNLTLEKAVDEMLSQIDEGNHQYVYQLAFNFVNENIESDQKWNIKKALLESAKLLTKENLIDKIEVLKNEQFSNEHFQQLKSEFDSLLKPIGELQKKLANTPHVSTVISNQLVSKGTTYKRLSKNIHLPLNELIFDKTSVTKSHFENVAKSIENVNEPFILQYFELLNCINQKRSQLSLLRNIISTYHTHALLKELANRMEDVRDSEATIRVSEFNALISNLINNEEAPFIYERLGSRYKHYFLDEFQDTSRLQWINMVPLIHNSLGENNFNFIVGDPKQSIYRFKNGVAEQFIALPEIYNPEKNSIVNEKSEYFKARGYKSGLEDNWRSVAEIVEFNNLFFEALKKHLPEQGNKFYDVVKQTPKGKKGGLIEIIYRVDSDVIPMHDTLNQLHQWVKQCIADGYKPNDICVLGNTNNEGSIYASFLKEQGYQVVSADALFIKNDLYVALALAFVDWKLNRYNNQALLRFASSYINMFYPDAGFEKLLQCMSISETGKQHITEELFYANTSFPSTLIDEGYQNVYSLLLTFFNTLKIDCLENSYIQQFLDYAYSFDSRFGTNLLAFFHDYNLSGKDTKVQMIENDDAIVLMTAHKSKGLEFPVVIIPSFDFFPKRKSIDTVLIEIEDHVVETRFSETDCLNENIKTESEKEAEATTMDRINLLYVAFTRAKDRLYASELTTTKAKAFLTIAETLIQLFPSSFNIDTLHIQLGTAPSIDHKEKRSEQAYHAANISEFLWFPEISLQSKKDIQDESIVEAIRLGNQFHYIMEKSDTLEGAIIQIQQGILKGILEVGFKEKLEHMIQQAFGDTQLTALFAAGEQLNERNVVVGPNEVLRPDKLIVSADSTTVIDFKTGEKTNAHTKQITAYINALKSVGYPNVRGYLYYVLGEGLIEVK
jgi:ATP-dependent exoDNAse (exonuclease V) beta subunit